MDEEVNELYEHVLENVPGLRDQIEQERKKKNEYFREWKKQNREKVNQWQRDWSHRNKERTELEV